MQYTVRVATILTAKRPAAGRSAAAYRERAANQGAVAWAVEAGRTNTVAGFWKPTLNYRSFTGYGHCGPPSAKLHQTRNRRLSLLHRLAGSDRWCLIAQFLQQLGGQLVF